MDWKAPHSYNSTHSSSPKWPVIQWKITLWNESFWYISKRLSFSVIWFLFILRGLREFIP
jgi:hypothetical protein